jgi:KDO2-lipid IV(A) lauroyltransferase
MRLRFRIVKDAISNPLDWLYRHGSPGLQRAVFGSAAVVGKAYYYMPGSHGRRTVRDFCRVADRTDVRQVYFGQVNRLVFALTTFGRLLRDETDAVADLLSLDEHAAATFADVKKTYGSCILVLPHCAASLVSAPGLHRSFDMLLLVRESSSEARCRQQEEYFRHFGTDLLFVRRATPAIVARAILGALKAGKFVLPLTDRVNYFKGQDTDAKHDTVRVQFLGQDVMLAAWPARFSAKRQVPIVPGYIRVENGRIVGSVAEPYIAQDLVSGTQQWVDYFEACIRRYPADWPFMLDKRWSRIIAAAAAQR